MTRKIENSDLWAAIRGLGLYRHTKEELQGLEAAHQEIGTFASLVIAEACRQVASAKLHAK